jgi:hypothetical protein
MSNIPDYLHTFLRQIPHELFMQIIFIKKDELLEQPTILHFITLFNIAFSSYVPFAFMKFAKPYDSSRSPEEL